MDKIRVAFIVNHSEMYGSNRALVNFINALEKNYDIEGFLVSGFNNGICNYFNNRNWQVEIIPHEYSIFPFIYSKTLWSMLKYPIRIVRNIIRNIISFGICFNTVRKFKPDLIHTNIGPDKLGYRVSKFLNVKHVWHIREYQTLDFNWKPFPTLNFNKRTFHSSNTIAITKGVFEYFELNKCKSNEIIYDSVINDFDVSFNPNKEDFILFVGRLEKEKGIIELIQCFSEINLNFVSTKLYILGKGQLEEYLKNYVQKRMLSDKIIFKGYVDNPASYMKVAKAIIVPSYNEGFGLITAEAILNGCLVIGRATGGTKEILEPDLGILFNNSDELKEHLNKLLLDDIDEYFPIIHKAQQIARLQYTIESSSDKIFNFINNILK